MMTGGNKGKKLEEGEWVCKALEKEVGFDLQCTKEMFMEVKKSFVEATTLGSHNQFSEEMDPSMITTFLETCVKLLHDRKAMKVLQELINKCVGNENAPEGPRIVKEIGNNKARIGHEMRLTVQIGKYEMDQFILDLGSNVNVFPKQTWERMGRPVLQWYPIQLRMENQ